MVARLGGEHEEDSRANGVSKLRQQTASSLRFLPSAKHTHSFRRPKVSSKPSECDETGASHIDLLTSTSTNIASELCSMESAPARASAHRTAHWAPSPTCKLK